MWTSSAAIPLLCKDPIRIACCTLLFWCTAVTGQEHSPNSPASDAVEQEALKVVNESDWAHTITPTIQDAPCTHGNPAFPGLYPEDKAAGIDATAPVVPNDVVKPDSSEYLIRFQSAKPVQAAIQRLLAMDEKWSAYGREEHYRSKDARPTDLPNAYYNELDMITIAVILKHGNPNGPNLFDYAFKDQGHRFPSDSFRVWPCAGLRTSNGQVFAHLMPTSMFGHAGEPPALQFSFPRLLVDGKPLISASREKIEFRLVANQRAFETTFYINASDVLDGSERSLYLPSAFTDLKEMARQW
jgi:hypothetical protein